jgi:hypothetical protein
MYERRWRCASLCLRSDPVLLVAVTAFSADLELYAPLIKAGQLLVLLLLKGHRSITRLNNLYGCMAALNSLLEFEVSCV